MECEVSSAVLATKASWPFDDPNAEVILRSSDNVIFGSSDVTCHSHLPSSRTCSLSVPQSMENTLRTLLPYPSSLCQKQAPRWTRCQTHLPSDNPQTRLCRRHKGSRCCRRLVRFDRTSYRSCHDLIIRQYLQSSPVSLYAIACLCGWRNLAERAARETLKIKDFGRVRTYVAELEDMSAGDYYRLLDYHRACATAAHTTDIQTELTLHFHFLDPRLAKT
ncbi:hypothetical protein BKA82DRAFT_2841131 [Pisolithus tinctorius]|nr:hypothetical protein BKA82DRAFT_2841131 [Pisolithus tinctorius]